MEEIWKPVSEVADWLQISNTGRLRSLDHKKFMQHDNREYWCTRKGKEYSPIPNPRYLFSVTIQDSLDNSINYKLYRDYLIYKYFIDDSITTKTPIYHIDGNYNNDSIDNLSLVSVYKATTDDETEIWKPINNDNLRDFYEVSNKGNVRSLERIIKKMFFQSTILNPFVDKLGYCSLKLKGKDGVKYAVSVHRLVAEAFIPNPDNLPEVNHKDFNPSNNCVDNLEWVTVEENIQYSAKQGRYHMKRPWAYDTVMTYRASKVRCITDGNEFDSMSQADRYYGYYPGRVSGALSHRNGKIEDKQFELLEV